MDIIDETLIKMVLTHNSIKEMAQQVGRSNGGVILRLTDLVQDGYINPPPKPGMARSYSLTPKGRDYLKERGYIGEGREWT